MNLFEANSTLPVMTNSTKLKHGASTFTVDRRLDSRHEKTRRDTRETETWRSVTPNTLQTVSLRRRLDVYSYNQASVVGFSTCEMRANYLNR